MQSECGVVNIALLKLEVAPEILKHSKHVEALL